MATSATTGAGTSAGRMEAAFARDGLRGADDLRFAADRARVAAAFEALSNFFKSFSSARAAFAAFFTSLKSLRDRLKAALASNAFFLARSNRFWEAEILAIISEGFNLIADGLLGVFFIENRIRILDSTVVG